MPSIKPTWDEYFLDMASIAASRSSCDRAHVGAVLVRDRQVLATGYNGSVRGLAHCDDIGHLMVDGHCVATIHAEQNAIAQAANHGVSVAGATLYVTHMPCIHCTKLVLNAGIVRIVYLEGYRKDDGDEATYRNNILLASGVEVTCFRGGFMNQLIDQAMADVLAERGRQDAKWGEQNHDMFLYLTILMEEVGELAQAALHTRFGGRAAGGLREEAVQTAAVALAIVECIDRDKWTWGNHASPEQ